MKVFVLDFSVFLLLIEVMSEKHEDSGVVEENTPNCCVKISPEQEPKECQKSILVQTKEQVLDDCKNLKIESLLSSKDECAKINVVEQNKQPVLDVNKFNVDEIKTQSLEESKKSLVGDLKSEESNKSNPVVSSSHLVEEAKKTNVEIPNVEAPEIAKTPTLKEPTNQEKTSKSFGNVSEARFGDASDIQLGDPSGSVIGVGPGTSNNLLPSGSSNFMIGASSSALIDQESSSMMPAVIISKEDEIAKIDNAEMAKSTEASLPLVQKKSSSLLYMNELGKISTENKFSVNKIFGVIPKPKSNKSGEIVEYTLIESLSETVEPIHWIEIECEEKIQQRSDEIQKKRQSAVLVNDEHTLQSNNFYYNKQRRLFHNKRKTFYAGLYLQNISLVKKLYSGKIESEVELDEPWINISKTITGICEPIEPSSPYLRKPSCPSLIQIFEIFYNSSSHHFFVFMEMAPNKSLHFMVKERFPVYVKDAKKWASQILNGVIYLQNNGISHRYVNKPKKIVFSKYCQNRSIRLEHIVLNHSRDAKIISWRRAVFFLTEDTHQPKLIKKRERRTRQNNHMPPEVFRENYDPRSVDVWSFGIILCAFTTFRYPFSYHSKRMSVEVDWDKFKKKHKDSVHPMVASMLDILFISDIAKRATIGDLQKCTFFTNQPSTNCTPADVCGGSLPKEPIIS